MFYLDTSLVVPYYCPALLSEKAETFITGNSPIALNSLTELEMFSAFLSHLDSHL